MIPDTRRKPRILTDPSVEGVCEDASDAGGTVTDAGERGTTILAPPLALRRAISHLIDNAVKYGDVTLTQARNRRKRLTNERNPLAQWRHAAINAQLQVSVLENRLHAYEQASLNLDRRGSAADELARQIAEFMRERPGLTIEDVRNAIDRRFGTQPSPRTPTAETPPAPARQLTLPKPKRALPLDHPERPRNRGKGDPLAKYLYPSAPRPMS